LSLDIPTVRRWNFVLAHKFQNVVMIYNNPLKRQYV